MKNLKLSLGDALSAAIPRELHIDGLRFKRVSHTLPNYVDSLTHVLTYEMSDGRQYRLSVEPIPETHGMGTSVEYPHASDCALHVGEMCDCLTAADSPRGRKLDQQTAVL